MIIVRFSKAKMENEWLSKHCMKLDRDLQSGEEYFYSFSVPRVLTCEAGDPAELVAFNNVNCAEQADSFLVIHSKYAEVQPQRIRFG